MKVKLTFRDYKKREYTYPADPSYVVGVIESCVKGYQEGSTDAGFAVLHIKDVVEAYNNAKGEKR